MLQLLIITTVVLAICFLAIGIGVWIKGKFPDTEVGHNPNMRKLGLCCAKEEELKLWNKNNDKTDFTCGHCSTCNSISECKI